MNQDRPFPAAAMRLLMITDGRGDAERIERLVGAAISGGLRAVQLREPGMGAAELARLCGRLRPRLREAGGLLIVNDRADVAAAGYADGVHLGYRSLSPAAVRRMVPDDCLVGFSAHDPEQCAVARETGADYLFLSPIFPTGSKPGHPGIGVERAQQWTVAAGLPVLWLGGLSAERIAALPAGCAARGYALLSEICGAEDPGAAVSEVLAAIDIAEGRS